MIQEQYPFIDEQGQAHNELIKHYSDDCKMIIQTETGIEYDEAIDVVPCRYTYEESDNFIIAEDVAEETDDDTVRTD